MLDKQKNLAQSFGTVEETTMKMSNGNKFPIFEIHHNNITSVINIVCFIDNKHKTNFIIGKEDKFPPSGSNSYVSMKKSSDKILSNDYKISKLHVIMCL